jgi:4-hydroxy-tetrahydrodipicolinate synthase
MILENVISLSNWSLKEGADAVIVVSPYYFKLTPDQIEEYYDRLAREIHGPLYIYNFPDRTGHTIAPATVKKLRDEHPNLRGMKDSVQTPGHTRDVCFAVDRPDFEMYSGFDDQYLANLAASGWGCISALSNLVPGIWSDLVRTQDAGDGPRSMELFRLITRLMQLYAVDTNFTKVFKRLLKDQGLPIQDFCVFPTRDLDEAKYAAGLRLLRDTLAEYEGL